MSSALYFRNPHAYWCFVHGFCIVLDVQHNSYLSLPSEAMERIIPYIHGEGSAPFKIGLQPMPPDLLPLAEELVAARVLTNARPAQSIHAHANTPRPSHLLPQFPQNRTGRGVRSLLPQFLRACAVADYQLCHLSFFNLVSRLLSRKYRRCRDNTDDAMTGMLTFLSSAFITLRPFYPRQYRCIFDCLALLTFLSNWGLFPNWVFGVSADPFSAHCWVQHNHLVLCDTRDFSATRFTPIMTI